MSNTSDTINNYDPSRKYFAQIPLIASRELNPYQLALYTNYVQTCGAKNGTTYKTHKTLANETGMSVAQVKRTRQELIDLGFISIEKRGRGKPSIISIADIWEENIAYQKAETDTERKAIVELLKEVSSERANSKLRESQPVSSERAINNNSTITTQNKKKDLTSNDVNDSTTENKNVASIIDAWVNGQTAKPRESVSPYENKHYRKLAKQLLTDGFTVENVVDFMKAKCTGDGFYLDKYMPFRKIGEEMPIWMESQKPSEPHPGYTWEEIQARADAVRPDPMTDDELAALEQHNKETDDILAVWHGKKDVSELFLDADTVN